MKTLYFEGAGWEGADVSKATVGNCRIRTAFHLDNGKAVYLEILGSEVNKRMAKRFQGFKYAGYVDYCHYITDDDPNDDCNKHCLPAERNTVFEYDHENILKFVNSLGASFDAVEVLPNLAGYRVFKEKPMGGATSYNYGDEFTPNWEVIRRTQVISEYFYELEKGEGKEYPNFSLWADEEDRSKLHLLRHFNGYNRHWLIDASTDDWESTIEEVKLGRYGC